MKIHFLGTTGWFCSDQGETTCLLVDAKEAYVIFDAGNAFRKVDKLITENKPVYLFLSHFHLDHIYGLHTLPKFRVEQGITIIGQPGTSEILNRIIASPFTCPIDKLKTKITIYEAKVGNNSQPIPFTCDNLIHADPCFGYRIKLENKTIAYCTDTGSCPAMNSLASNADLLITECAWRERNQIPGWPHLAPEDAAEAARDSSAKKLALMHFDAEGYQEQENREDALQRAKEIFSNTIITHDDLVIDL